MDESKIRTAIYEATVPPAGWSGDLFFTNKRGEKIRYGHAPALTDNPRGVVVHTHGFNESIDLYFETLRWYQSQGFAVWAYDLSGHGLSEGKRPNDNPSPQDIRHAIDDLDEMATTVVRRIPGKKLILSTHSFSGHIALHHLRERRIFNAAVMSSPMFDIFRGGLPFALRPVLSTLFSTACLLGQGKKNLPGVSHVPKGQEMNSTEEPNYRYHAKRNIMDLHPERYTHQQQSLALTALLFQVTKPTLKESFLKQVGSCHTPILIGSAGARENLVAIDAHDRAARLIPGATLVRIDKAVHPLWLDRDACHTQWLGHVSQFLYRVCPPIATPLIERKVVQEPAFT